MRFDWNEFKFYELVYIICRRSFFGIRDLMLIFFFVYSMNCFFVLILWICFLFFFCRLYWDVKGDIK